MYLCGRGVVAQIWGLGLDVLEQQRQGHELRATAQFCDDAAQGEYVHARLEAKGAGMHERVRVRTQQSEEQYVNIVLETR